MGRVVEELNHILTTLVPEANLVLELIRWQTHVHPGLGSDAQDVVNRQLGIGAYDVFVGIFWLRFGKPTPRADSGTEEEFDIAHRAWTKGGRSIQIMVYFCRAPATLADSEASRQQTKVLELREKLFEEGLVRDYGEHAEFASAVRGDLVLVLGRMLHATTRPAAVAGRTAELATDDDRGATWDRISELAGEYDRIRREEEGEPSAERTRRMEVVASTMRGMALSAYPFLHHLTTSSSAGERLVAICVLEAIPEVGHLRWLAERLQPWREKPFVGKHAALGILSAARSLAVEDLPEVRAALKLARQGVRARDLRASTARSTVLSHVEEELARRLPGG